MGDHVWLVVLVDDVVFAVELIDSPTLFKFPQQLEVLVLKMFVGVTQSIEGFVVLLNFVDQLSVESLVAHEHHNEAVVLMVQQLVCRV